MEIGFTLSSEEQGPKELVHLARGAEEAGFSFATISDHFHPWTSHQGNSPFVWSVLGAIAEATSQIRVGTAVTWRLIRIHPAIVAQAAATVAEMMPGRFFLGVGTGENLNEHVTGQRWPSANERRELLKEAIEVVRSLWRVGCRAPGAWLPGDRRTAHPSIGASADLRRGRRTDCGEVRWRDRRRSDRDGAGAGSGGELH